jgi:hypothetical protein
MKISQEIQKNPLKGTPKQKEWAQIIRARKAKRLEEIGLIGILKILRPLLSNELLEAMACTDNRGFKAMAWSVCHHATSNEDASWWIKTREEDPEKWIETTGIGCIQEWTKTKPFNNS